MRRYAKGLFDSGAGITEVGPVLRHRPITDGAPDPIPEPATLALMGLGLAGIGFSKRRKTPKVA